MKRRQGSRAISLGVGVASSGVVPLGRGLEQLWEHRLCGHGTQDSTPTPPAAVCVLT